MLLFLKYEDKVRSYEKIHLVPIYFIITEQAAKKIFSSGVYFTCKTRRGSMDIKRGYPFDPKGVWWTSYCLVCWPFLDWSLLGCWIIAGLVVK